MIRETLMGLQQLINTKVPLLHLSVELDIVTNQFIPMGWDGIGYMTFCFYQTINNPWSKVYTAAWVDAH